METDLINRKLLRSKYNDWLNELYSDIENNNYETAIGDTIKDCIYELDNQPTVDAEVVKHGYWKHKIRHFGGFEKRTGITESGEVVAVTIDNRWEEDMPYCSICGKFTEEIPDPKYCPHCWAKMDGEVKE